MEKQKGLSNEDKHEAARLYGRHKQNADMLVRARETLARGDALRPLVKKAFEDGTEETIPYSDRVFANGDTAQRSAVSSAKLHHDANLWASREHYLERQGEYIEQAVIDAAESGITIDLEDKSPSKN